MALLIVFRHCGKFRRIYSTDMLGDCDIDQLDEELRKVSVEIREENR